MNDKYFVWDELNISVRGIVYQEKTTTRYVSTLLHTFARQPGPSLGKLIRSYCRKRSRTKLETEDVELDCVSGVKQSGIPDTCQYDPLEIIRKRLNLILKSSVSWI